MRTRPALGWAIVSCSIVGSHAVYIGALPYHLIGQKVAGLELGLVLGSFAAGTLVTRLLLFCSWASRVTMTRLVLAGSLLLALSQLGYLVSEAPAVFAGLRFMNGAANAILFFCLFSILPADNREASRSIGMIAGGAAIALIAGAPTGFYICTERGIETVIAIGALCALSAVGAFRGLTNWRQVADQSEREPVRLDGRQIILCLSLVLMTYALGSLETLLPLLSKDISRPFIVMSFIGFGAGFIGGRFLGGKSSLDVRGKTTVRMLLSTAAVAAIGSGLYPSGATVLPAAVTLGAALGFGQTWASSTLTLSSAVPSRASLALTGQIVSDAGLGAGILITPILFGEGKVLAFMMVGICCCLSLVSTIPQKARDLA